MHDHDRGLEYDLGVLRRRNVLRLFAGAGLAVVAGCSADDGPAGASSPSTTSSNVEEIPAETAGPYPGDGSNGPNVLTESGIVRRDLTKSFGSASGVAEGVPLTVELVVLDAAKDTPLPGAAVYLWHCDAQGRYSLYDGEIEGENYCRGVQAADASGKVTFTTVFPGAYQGRWPHIHFEVYVSLAEATAAGKISATSQLALPADASNAVYATSGYDGSAQNMARTSLENDMVFRDDGAVHQLATMSGGVQEGYTARLTVGV
jgi:protocatechuate 3,4-dioxygenase beta subunit